MNIRQILPVLALVAAPLPAFAAAPIEGTWMLGERERKIFELAICFIVSYRICLEFFLKRYEERTSPEKLSESEKNHQIPY